MIPSEYLLPYLTSNAIALGLLWLAVRRPGWVRWASIGIFLWATYTNTRIALFHPHDYQDFARLAVLASYRSFITGWFRNHTALVLLPIAAGQCAIALLLLRNTPLTRRLGVLGALSFLLAIAPLGAGSAFPFSLTYGLALVVMMRRLDRETRADVAASPLHPFIPAFDARERFAVTVRAPAQLVDQVARAFDMQSIPLVRAIFRMREWLMGVTPDPRPVQGFIAEMRGLGWGALVDRPGEVVRRGCHLPALAGRGPIHGGAAGALPAVRRTGAGQDRVEPGESRDVPVDDRTRHGDPREGHGRAGPTALPRLLAVGAVRDHPDPVADAAGHPAGGRGRVSALTSPPVPLSMIWRGGTPGEHRCHPGERLAR